MLLDNELNYLIRRDSVFIHALAEPGHLENITGTPLSLRWETEDKVWKMMTRVKGLQKEVAPLHPWIKESCYYHSKFVSSIPCLTRNYEIPRKHH